MDHEPRDAHPEAADEDAQNGAWEDDPFAEPPADDDAAALAGDAAPDSDLDACPLCGTEGFRLVGEERVYGYAGIALDREPDGSWTARWDGGTEMDWGSSRTTVYLCRDCDAVLPEWYARWLDDLLNNDRRPTHTSEWAEPPGAAEPAGEGTTT